MTGFSRSYDEFKKLGAEVLAVSCDSIYAHQAWIRQDPNEGGLGRINFPIASDMTRETSKQYGFLIEEEYISLRGLVIISPDGDIKYSVVHDLSVGRSIEETLRVLKAFKSGGLCPIDWHEGDPTL